MCSGFRVSVWVGGCKSVSVSVCVSVCVSVKEREREGCGWEVGDRVQT